MCAHTHIENTHTQSLELDKSLFHKQASLFLPISRILNSCASFYRAMSEYVTSEGNECNSTGLQLSHCWYVEHSHQLHVVRLRVSIHLFRAPFLKARRTFVLSAAETCERCITYRYSVTVITVTV